MDKQLFKYLLRLGDTSLIIGHRLGEYSSNGPFLEEDLAITNVALDHIGQAEELLKYAGEVEGEGRSEDDLAYKRPETEYYNVQLVEYPNKDFAYIMARQFYLDVFNVLLYRELTSSKDATLAAIAAKSLKEVTYHLRRSSEWIIRLGQGTEESKRRIQQALEDLWMYTGELFEMDDTDHELIDRGIAADLQQLMEQWVIKVQEILDRAGLSFPSGNYMASGSRKGYHTENMGYILAEMQYLPRTYADAKW